jgi:hypothetical protein
MRREDSDGAQANMYSQPQKGAGERNAVHTRSSFDKLTRARAGDEQVRAPSSKEHAPVGDGIVALTAAQDIATRGAVFGASVEAVVSSTSYEEVHPNVSLQNSPDGSREALSQHDPVVTRATTDENRVWLPSDRAADFRARHATFSGKKLWASGHDPFPRLESDFNRDVSLSDLDHAAGDEPRLPTDHGQTSAGAPTRDRHFDVETIRTLFRAARNGLLDPFARIRAGSAQRSILRAHTQ